MASYQYCCAAKNSEPSSLFLYGLGSLKLLRLATLITVVLTLSACHPETEEWVFSGPIMGTQYRVTVVSLGDPSLGDLYLGDLELDQKRLERKIVDAMEAVNQSMSTYIPDSELSKFNRLKAGESAQLSPGLLEVMDEALQISKQSNGAFDVTLGKAIRLWGFSEDGQIETKPSPEELNKLKQSVGYQNLALEGQTLKKLANDLEVNVSAIAKGYAVDKVAETLTGAGIEHFLIDIGGELRAKGFNANKDRWRVGVERPHLTGGVAQVVELKNASIATSGDYRNFIVIDGEQFSHTISPDTLKPVFHKLASVSVIAPKASTADALATAILAKGEDEGVAFAEQHGIAAYFIIREDTENEFRLHVTKEFEPFLPK